MRPEWKPGNCPRCGEPTPQAIEQEGFLPVNLTVGGYVYIEQGKDGFVIMERRAACELATAILVRCKVDEDNPQQ